MDATAHEEMLKTGIAPCGCARALEHEDLVHGNETWTVFHTCDPDRQAVSEAANQKAIDEHMERQERKMLLNSIPVEKLRALFNESGGELKERKTASAKS